METPQETLKRSHQGLGQCVPDTCNTGSPTPLQMDNNTSKRLLFALVNEHSAKACHYKTILDMLPTELSHEQNYALTQILSKH